jgi:hypothetical protein
MDIRKSIKDKENKLDMRKLLLLLPFLVMFNCQKDSVEPTRNELLVGQWTEEFAPSLGLWTLIDFKSNGDYKLSVVDSDYNLVQVFHVGTYEIVGDSVVRTFVNESGINFVESDEFVVTEYVLLLSQSEYARVR